MHAAVLEAGAAKNENIYIYIHLYVSILKCNQEAFASNNRYLAAQICVFTLLFLFFIMQSHTIPLAGIEITGLPAVKTFTT